eukprot:TRINITY_DN2608_c0_g3_i6.p1 TRINITY_DN2608_c0_g3~~TRINITY_DN2608_c0_g3_i6.p1  ORF type:complete len:202 (-),score=42.85 TRINITY_DN2608_c0_g3_i6:181-786(-)
MLSRQLQPPPDEVSRGISFWSRENDTGVVNYWYDKRWNKWNPKPLGERFKRPRGATNRQAWQVVADYLSTASPDVLSVLPHVSQDLMHAATWRVEFSLEYVTSPGDELYVIGSTGALGNWEIAQNNRMLWTSGHVWRLTKRIKPGSTFLYKYAARYPSGYLRIEDGPNRVWQRHPRDPHFASAYKTGNTVLIRDFFGHPPT